VSLRGIFLVGALVFATPPGFANTDAVVCITNRSGVQFTGTFIRKRILVTIRHALSNETDGGITYDGARSIRVTVPNEPPGDDGDLAFVLFDRDVAPTISPVNSGRDTLIKGDTVQVVSMRRGRRREGYEELVGPGTLSDRKTHAYARTTATNGWRPGDSGSALFSKKGAFVGPLRGCSEFNDQMQCGFFMLTGPAGMKTYRKAARELREGFRD